MNDSFHGFLCRIEVNNFSINKVSIAQLIGLSFTNSQRCSHSNYGFNNS